ncbi:MAG: M56 family metallopeptidase [Chthoniobacteraceae bacterium]|jgi:beta-lactamase regulating signal transducer with metallopeptidase domain
MSLLLTLTIRGSLAFLLVWALDVALAGRMRASGRRWWWMLVPLAWLVSIPLPIPHVERIAIIRAINAPMAAMDAPATDDGGTPTNGASIWLWLWLAGAAIYLLAVVIQTRIALHRWSHERLSTDSALLDLLEDCKAEAGITAPLGLVVSERVSAPAILGWVRPRILIPKESALSREELRAVLFHELAHFRSLDMPCNWLFTLARAVHWFNPLAHLAFHAWARFREEAADEKAMAWMKESSGATYGQALLHAIKQANAMAMPFGALAIGESIHNLKRRISMINRYQTKSPCLILAATVATLIAALFLVQPIQAGDGATQTAVPAMKTWLHEIDQGQYAQSWTDASPFFKKAITSDGWVAASKSVRDPLGQCTSRVLASALHQTDVPGPTGVIKGDFVVAQFRSTFQNLAYAVETVSFEKIPDGSWKAAGYYIKPGP